MGAKFKRANGKGSFKASPRLCECGCGTDIPLGKPAVLFYSREEGPHFWKPLHLTSKEIEKIQVLSTDAKGRE